MVNLYGGQFRNISKLKMDIAFDLAILLLRLYRADIQIAKLHAQECSIKIILPVSINYKTLKI